MPPCIPSPLFEALFEGLGFNRVGAATASPAAALRVGRRSIKDILAPRALQQRQISGNAPIPICEMGSILNLGKCSALLAAQPDIGPSKQIEHWRAARDAYQKSLDIYQEMKSKGTLSGADAGKPGDLAHEIANWDAVLNR
jgi:hypothetical protein